MDITNNFDNTNILQEKSLAYEPIVQPDLGMLIKKNRKDQKLSQKQLGERLNVSYQTIANWESGLRAPSPANLMRLAIALDKPDIFFFRTVQRQNVEPDILTLSVNLRNYRGIFGLSQVKLSELASIPLAKIKAYEDENSGYFISNEDLNILCKVFHTTPAELLGKSATAETMQDLMKRNYLLEIEDSIKKLNLAGLQKAAERIAELTELPRYCQ